MPAPEGAHISQVGTCRRCLLGQERGRGGALLPGASGSSLRLPGGFLHGAASGCAKKSFILTLLFPVELFLPPSLLQSSFFSPTVLV